MLNRAEILIIFCSSRIGAQASKYSQLESEIAAMQRNSATYCEEPAAGPAFDSWLKGFDLDAQTDEIKKITEDNAFMSELQVCLLHLAPLNLCALVTVAVVDLCTVQS